MVNKQPHEAEEAAYHARPCRRSPSALEPSFTHAISELPRNLSPESLLEVSLVAYTDKFAKLSFSAPIFTKFFASSSYSSTKLQITFLNREHIRGYASKANSKRKTIISKSHTKLHILGVADQNKRNKEEETLTKSTTKLARHSDRNPT